MHGIFVSLHWECVRQSLHVLDVSVSRDQRSSLAHKDRRRMHSTSLEIGTHNTCHEQDCCDNHKKRTKRERPSYMRTTNDGRTLLTPGVGREYSDQPDS